MIRTLGAIMAACSLLLAACAPSVAVRPSAPLQIVRTRYIPIPAELLQRCPIPHPPLTTWGTLAQAYLSMRAALTGCAAQVDAIRNTVGTGH